MKYLEPILFFIVELARTLVGGKRKKRKKRAEKPEEYPGVVPDGDYPGCPPEGGDGDCPDGPGDDPGPARKRTAPKISPVNIMGWGLIGGTIVDRLFH